MNEIPNWIFQAAQNIVHRAQRLDNDDSRTEQIAKIIAEYAPGWAERPNGKGKWFQMNYPTAQPGGAKLRSVQSAGACGKGMYFGPVEMPAEAKGASDA